MEEPEDLDDSDVFAFGREDYDYLIGTGPPPKGDIPFGPFFQMQEYDSERVNLSHSEEGYQGNQGGKFDDIYYDGAIVVSKAQGRKERVKATLMLALRDERQRPLHPQSQLWRLPKDVLAQIVQLVVQVPEKPTRKRKLSKSPEPDSDSSDSSE